MPDSMVEERVVILLLLDRAECMKDDMLMMLRGCGRGRERGWECERRKEWVGEVGDGNVTAGMLCFPSICF